MKKLLCLSLLIASGILQACNLCRGHQSKHKRLYRAPYEKVPCDCNCGEQPKVKIGQGHGYGCITCGHRLYPEDPFAKNCSSSESELSSSENETWQPSCKKIKRYAQASKKSVVKFKSKRKAHRASSNKKQSKKRK